MSRQRTSFFSVTLVCEAAPHIGCGTRARPALADLDREPGVREAWLNRGGTVLALVWADGARDPGRAQSILHRHGIDGVELKGRQRGRSCRSFAAGGWYRAVRMQDLSAEEARVIAARLICRLGEKVPLSADAARRLSWRLEGACAQALAAASASCARTRRDQIAAALLDAGREVLDSPALQALAEAVSLGHRPLPGER